MRWLRYEKGKFGNLQYKTNLDPDEPFKTVNIKKRGFPNLTRNSIPVVDKVPKISKAKKKDLIDMLQFVSQEFHPFYHALVDSDIEGDALADSTDEEHTSDDER